jgi:hypothetical protein
MPSSTYDIASQHHVLAQNQDCFLCAPTVKTVLVFPILPADSPSSLLPACCKNGHPSPCVAPLPVCCVPPTHVTPPRRAAFGSVAYSAGGLRKERGYAWGVSGRDVCLEESTQCGGRTIASAAQAQRAAPEAYHCSPVERVVAHAEEQVAQERAVDAVIPRSGRGRGWQRRPSHVACDLQVLLVVEVEVREPVGRVGRGEVDRGVVGARRAAHPPDAPQKPWKAARKVAR